MQYAVIIKNNEVLLTKGNNDTWRLPKVSRVEENRIGVHLPIGNYLVSKTGQLEMLFNRHTLYLSQEVNSTPAKNERIGFFGYDTICEPGFRLCLQSRIAIDELYVKNYLKLEG